MCSPGLPVTHYVDQAKLELKTPPASTHELRLKV